MAAGSACEGTGLIFEMMVSCGVGTPQALADRFGMTDSHFTRIRRNRIPMSMDTATAVAGHIGLHLMQLWVIPVLSDRSLHSLKGSDDPVAFLVLEIARRFGSLDGLDGRNEILGAYCRDLFGKSRSADGRAPREAGLVFRV